MDIQAITRLIFESGTLRGTPRSHRQLLLTRDDSDNIAAHSFQVAVIGFFLAHLEGVDPYKVVVMCLFHDLGETRTGDKNWVHRPYVVEDEPAIVRSQFGPFEEIGLPALMLEQLEHKSPEARVVKDADVLGQILLLLEYARAGNKEAEQWLGGRTEKRPYAYVDYLRTPSGQALGRSLYDTPVNDWWAQLYSGEKRKK
ncbi:MAG: HD domain-containing protein [Candidatus Paceibacterota bacterium]